MEWDTVIGLEIHVQLQTKSKLFSGAATKYGAAPNTQACAVDLGLPGVLPVLNKEAVAMAVKFGCAVGAAITKNSVFARKNYFYPDLPKGYQISQMDLPIVVGGTISFTLEDGSEKIVNLERAHLEEDAGKLVHDAVDGFSCVDLNRAGTPLIEIVSHPEMYSAAEAIAYLKKVHTLVRYLGISDGNMQEGSFRCDANISIKPKGSETLGTRAEIKNVNSFKFVEKAINYEVARQTDILENGGKVAQETRLYDSEKNTTRAMRSKEEANDYRYFPDPDLLPATITDEFINTIRESLPELPDAKSARFIADYALNDYDAGVLTASKSLADYFELTVTTNNNNPKTCANWVMGELLGALNKEHLNIDSSPISATNLSGLIARIGDNTISGKIAKTVFAQMWSDNNTADKIIESQGLKQVTDTGAIEKLIDAVLAANPDQVAKYKDGFEKMFGFFVGKVMQQSKGRANPAQVNDLLKQKLK